MEFIDDIIKLEIIVAAPDRKTEHFFRQFKKYLKDVLQQIDILITVQTIRTL